MSDDILKGLASINDYYGEPVDPDFVREVIAEIERLRAENASLRAGTIRTDSGAVIAALEAEIERLRAQPRVHPLAWDTLVERHKLTQEANSLLGLGRAINEDGTRSPYTAASDHYMDSEQAMVLADAMAAWDEEGCPLLAEGDADTPLWLREEEIERLRARLADHEDDARRVLSEQCAPDERHCACVPVLRARVAELEAELEAVKRTVVATTIGTVNM